MTRPESRPAGSDLGLKLRAPLQTEPWLNQENSSVPFLLLFLKSLDFDDSLR